MSIQDMMDFQAIGYRIRALRQIREMTQADLAMRVGVTASFIGHIERAEKVPSLETMMRLCVALDTTMDWLVLGLKHRCEGDACPLFDDLKSIICAYGLGNKK